MSFTIIQAKEEHAPIVTALGAKTFLDTFGPDNPVEEMEAFLKETYTHELQLEEIKNPLMHTYIAFDESEKPVGFCQLRQKQEVYDFVGDPEAIELQRMYVDKECGRKGFGSKLMDQAVKTAKALGKKTIWLGVWEFNPKAIQFYEKHGFRIVGSHIFKVGEKEDTDLIMIKDISVL